MLTAVFFPMNHFLCMPFRFPVIVRVQTKPLWGFFRKTDWNKTLACCSFPSTTLVCGIQCSAKPMVNFKKGLPLKAFDNISFYPSAIRLIRVEVITRKTPIPCQKIITQSNTSYGLLSINTPAPPGSTELMRGNAKRREAEPLRPKPLS